MSPSSDPQDRPTGENPAAGQKPASGADPTDEHSAASVAPSTAEPASVSDWAAAVLVFGASAAVLVVELVALRLLAPYLGLTLETNTLVIGMALTAIAAGSWWGGQAADRIDPRAALAPLLAASGAAVSATPFLVRLAGTLADGALLLVASAVTIVVPGALLSAVTPMVTKLRLTSLTQTGTIVGRLSGIGTAGSIVGTVVTGFVLVSRVPVTGIMVGLGVALLLAAVAVAVLLRRIERRHLAGGAAAALVLGAATVATPSGCDAETTYHCATVVADPQRPDGRTLVLDGLRHSYVDVADPTHLEFAYVRSIAAAVDAFAPPGSLRVHNIGGGGLTLPRYLADARPGTSGTVSEIDAGVVRIDREDLALPADLPMDIRVEDGRVGLRAIADTSVDLVIGDAFGGVSVPWHLATQEAVGQIRRVLAPGGLYAVNLIDYAPLDFARAEVATIRTQFPHVLVASSPPALAPSAAGGRGGAGGNLVVLASQRPLDAQAWQRQLTARGVPWTVLSDPDIDAWVGDAPLLTDDYAPVDQLLTPYPAPAGV